MYLGTDSTDTTPRFALGFGNYLDTINGRYLPTIFELSTGKYLRVQMTANYRRASQGLDGIGVDRDFDYYIYCGNEAWSDSVCANAPTWNSWSYYWGGNWGPVRQQSLGKAIIDDRNTDKRRIVLLLLDSALSIVLGNAEFGFSPAECRRRKSGWDRHERVLPDSDVVFHGSMFRPVPCCLKPSG